MTYTEIQNVANPRRIQFDVEDYATLSLTIIGGSVTATAVTAAFTVTAEENVTKETSLTRWSLIQGQRVETGAVQSSISNQTITANTVYATYIFNVAAFKDFRMTVSAITAGPFDVIIGLSKVTTAFTPIAPLATQPVSGTVGVTNALLASTAAGGFKAEDAAHVSGDVGVFTLGVRNDNAASTYASANGDYAPVAVDNSGTALNKTKPANTTGINAITPGTATAQLASANAARRGGIIQNNSNVVIFVKLGATPATTSAGGYSITMAAATGGVGPIYELPVMAASGIQVIAASAGTGSVVWTELTD